MYRFNPLRDLLRGRVGRTGLFLAVVLTLMLAALPTAAMAAPPASYGQNDNYGCGDCYIVQRGDTLSQIAKWYHVSLWELARYNRISNPSKIYVGQKIYIPDGGYGHGDGGYQHGGYDQGGYHQDDHGQGCDGCDGYNQGGYQHGGYDQGDQHGGYDQGGYQDGGYDQKHDGCGGCGGYGDGRYVVQAGDTLSQIAKWNHVSVDYLCRKNGISNPSKIYVGQVIWL